MKKTLFGLRFASRLLIAAALVMGLAFAACSGKKQPGAAASQILTVGATAVPHAELLNLVKDDLALQGITLKVVEFTDYVQPNVGVINGDLDANFFQHIPYLETNEEWNAKLISAFGVHVEPFGLYSSQYKSVSDLPNGASIAIPNDPTNGGRALLLLQARGLITLKNDAGLAVTPHDVVDNPHNFSFKELEAAQLPRSLGDVDAAAINGNYALAAGLSPLRDSLIIEGAESPYVNIVVVQRGKESDPRIIALKNALLSQKVRDYIIDKWGDGSVTPIF
jgi:D-methionine transport system substrate-binding protein